MAKGGKQPGAGRPPGSLNKSTLERRKVELALQQRILHHADSLLNAQMSLAKGVTHVYRIDEVEEGSKKRREHVLVTDPDEIKALLDEHEGGDGVVEDNYYYISTKDPSNLALDSLLNRGIGKPADNVDLTSKGEKITITDEQFNQIIGATVKRGGRNKGGA